METNLPAPWALQFHRSGVVCTPSLHATGSDASGCACRDEAWTQFRSDLEELLASLGEHAWLVRSYEDPDDPDGFCAVEPLHSLEAHQLSRRVLVGAVDIGGDQISVSFDGRSLWYRADGDLWELEAVPTGRDELYKLLDALYHDDALDVALEMPEVYLEIAETYARRLVATQDYVDEDEFPDERFCGVSARTLTPAELEVARSLAAGEWQGDLSELLEAATGCLALV